MVHGSRNDNVKCSKFETKNGTKKKGEMVEILGKRISADIAATPAPSRGRNIKVFVSGDFNLKQTEFQTYFNRAISPYGNQFEIVTHRTLVSL